MICFSPVPAAREETELLLEHFKHRWRDLLRRLAQTTAVDGRLPGGAASEENSNCLHAIHGGPPLVGVLMFAVKASLKVELLHSCCCLGLGCGPNGCLALAQARGEAVAALLDTLYVNLQTPSAEVVGGVDYVLEKGVSNI